MHGLTQDRLGRLAEATTQRYPHSSVHKITAAGTEFSAHLSVLRATIATRVPEVVPAQVLVPELDGDLVPVDRVAEGVVEMPL